MVNQNGNENENENRSHRYGLNWPRSRHGRKYSKYKKWLSMMMLICDVYLRDHIWSCLYNQLKFKNID